MVLAPARGCQRTIPKWETYHLFQKLLNDPVLAPGIRATSLSDDHSVQEPPEPIPNSEVKMLSADDSVGDPM